eukprot:3139455-Prymnesium_polylepis.1
MDTTSRVRLRVVQTMISLPLTIDNSTRVYRTLVRCQTLQSDFWQWPTASATNYARARALRRRCQLPSDSVSEDGGAPAPRSNASLQ